MDKGYEQYKGRKKKASKHMKRCSNSVIIICKLIYQTTKAHKLSNASCEGGLRKTVTAVYLQVTMQNPKKKQFGNISQNFKGI